MKTCNLIQTVVLAVCMIGWISCDNTEDNERNLTSRITVKGIASNTKTALDSSPIVFTGDDIVWFNTKTREIKFRNIEPRNDFPLYKEIVFELDGIPLFTAATLVSDINSQLYTDLVLYFASPTEENNYKGGYYLNDGYPIWAGAMEEAKENARKRTAGWNQFINQLREEGKIKDKEDKMTYLNTTNKKILDDYFAYSIAFDKDGNAWIGTFKQGLIKYNGQESVYYNSSNSPFSDDMVIYSVAADSKNNIWIGSDAKGLIRYDGKEFSTFNSSNSPIPEDFIHSIRIDSKDNLWFSSSRFRQGGLVRFDGKSEWKVFTPDNSKMTGHLINDIAIDKNDDVWVGLGDHVDEACLVKVSGNKMNTYSDKDFGFRTYQLGGLCVNSTGKLYISVDYSLSSSMYHDGPHLFSFDGKTGSMIDCPFSNIRSITTDSQDNIWCIGSSFNDVLMYDGSDWYAANIFPNGENEGIFCIEEAPDGKIWVGTGRGVYIIDRK